MNCVFSTTIPKYKQSKILAILGEDYKYYDNVMFRNRRKVAQLLVRRVNLSGVEVTWNRILSSRFSDCSQSTESQIKSRSHILSPDEEQDLFQQYNYGRRKLSFLKKKRHISLPVYREIVKWHDFLVDIRKKIVVANLGLIMHYGKLKSLTHIETFGDIFQHSIPAIYRCINKFDPNRGSKFSTYLTFALQNDFSRFGQVERQSHFFKVRIKETGSMDERTILSCNFADPVFDVPDEGDREAKENKENAKHFVTRGFGFITYRQREILKMLYGMDGWQPCTLQVCANRFKISRERVSQISREALSKMKFHLKKINVCV